MWLFVVNSLGGLALGSTVVFGRYIRAMIRHHGRLYPLPPGEGYAAAALQTFGIVALLLLILVALNSGRLASTPTWRLAGYTLAMGALLAFNMIIGLELWRRRDHRTQNG